MKKILITLLILLLCSTANATLLKREFETLDWITDEGHAAQTADLPYVTGILHVLDIKISSVTGNPTVNVTLTDRTDTSITLQLESFSTLADGTLHRYLVNSKEFDADHDIDGHVFVGNNLRISVDPSADPGGAAQTLEVDVSLILEQ